MDYEELIEEAYKKIKPLKEMKERFETPRAQTSVEGNKTIVQNFMQIASYFRRNPEQLQKFLLKELAVPGNIEGDRLIIIGKPPVNRINEKLEQYAQEFVICRECKKPDTELIKDSHHKLTIMHCLACRAKHPVRS